MKSAVRRFLLIWFTTLNLTPKQILFRIYYKLRNRIIGRRNLFNPLKKKGKIFNFIPRFLDKPDCFFRQDISFSFLNRTHAFNRIEAIDFGFFKYGELWCYTLNYFDFIIQDNITFDDSKALILTWLEKHYPYNHITFDSYPVSMRIVNFIKWCSIYHNRLSDQEKALINTAICKQINYLTANLEYHLMGNHLLENLISLLFGAVYFNSGRLFRKYRRQFINQLHEQIPEDGFHFELSIMYHNIILEKLLDLYYIIIHNRVKFAEEYFVSLLKKKIIKMLNTSRAFLYKNNSYPCFNDTIREHATQTTTLFNYAEKLGFKTSTIPDRVMYAFNKAGYIKYRSNEIEFIADIGPIGPRYTPGHGHCDALSFELVYKGEPIIVNTGTSEYDYGPLRTLQRSTAAHNTAHPESHEQSEIWSRFRVARQVKVTERNIRTNGDLTTISGTIHNYNNTFSHKRMFHLQKNTISILDSINTNKQDTSCFSYIHLHPDIIMTQVENYYLLNRTIKIHFENFNKIDTLNYDFATGLNKTVKSTMLRIRFPKDKELKTVITFLT